MFPLFNPKTGISYEILSRIAANIAPSPPTATITSALETSSCPYKLSKSLETSLAFLFLAILK